MELEQTIQDWGTPEWAIPAVAAWIRSGGTLDRDLWVALRAAAQEGIPMTDQTTDAAAIDRNDARTFRITCRLDARTFRMLQDIERHVRVDSRRAPRSAAIRSAIRTLHRALWPNGTGK